MEREKLPLQALDELCVTERVQCCREVLGAGICHCHRGAQAEQEPEERANEVKEEAASQILDQDFSRIFLPVLISLWLQEGSILVARLSSKFQSQMFDWGISDGMFGAGVCSWE